MGGSKDGQGTPGERRTEIDEALTIAELDKRYMPREVCIIRTEAIENIGVSMESTRKELGEIKGILATAAQWMKSHQDLHEVVEKKNNGVWQKIGIAAAIAATFLTGATLAFTVLTVLMKYKP